MHGYYSSLDKKLPIHTIAVQAGNGSAILCLTPRTTVTSLSMPKDTRCKTHPLCVNPGFPF